MAEILVQYSKCLEATVRNNSLHMLIVALKMLLHGREAELMVACSI